MLQQGQNNDGVLSQTRDILSDGDENFQDGNSHLDDETEKVQLMDDDEEEEEEEVPVTQESLGTRMEKIWPDFKSKDTRGANWGAASRYSGRIAEKYGDDVTMLDRAKELKSKNMAIDTGNLADFPTIANSSNATLLDIASVVGVSLGVSLDMVENNLSIMRAQEAARVNMFLASSNPSSVES